MTAVRDPAALDWSEFLCPGDHLVIGQACGEPTTLLETLLPQAARIGELSAFVATSFSGTFTPESVAGLRIRSMGAIGTLRSLTAAHALDVIACHVGQIGPMIESGAMPCDCAVIQVAPADRDGNHSLGLIADHVGAAVRAARVVVAEINDQVPLVPGETVAGSEIDYAIEVSRPPVTVAPARIGPIDEAIAAHAAAYIGDGAVLQTGVGAVPDALLRALTDRRDLGVHSGMVGDGLVDLVEAGALTNARKRIDTGVSVTGALIGSRRLYDFADRNPAIRLSPATYTHDPAVLAGIDDLISINSAMQIDLTGQVNAEQHGSAYLGGTGGQVDFVRGGARSRGGHAIIALPATAKGGTVSRISAALAGPVTTARSEVDIVVTEFGAAELAGRTLAERARRLVEIAHPDFRAELEQAAAEIEKRGF
ncbi:acetyl-CoA hydrolase/transferase family protein [Nocardia nova]|uniref:acetyl-CoA hydrolase/transferase family protein n=1 Tax=Nocardia nova TaxID=37330 RepID=UPI0033D00F3E